LNVIVDTTPPGGPELLSPDNNRHENNNTPTFCWENVYDPPDFTYELRYLTGTEFLAIWFDPAWREARFFKADV